MKNQKVICLMPVKNEVDILSITLPILSQYCDIIIIADQMSDDGSREIYPEFPKVKVIDNPREGHSNQVRWDLLKEARKYGSKGNLILCLDADEYIPSTLFKKFLNEYEFNVNDSFRFPWIQLWKSIDYFNNTGVWFRNYQRAAWIDDGETNYDTDIVINDHTSRVPSFFLHNCKKINSLPIIHLQWVSWRKTQFKQALYRCTELIKNPENYISINSSYSHSLEHADKKLSRTPKEWLEDYPLLKKVEEFKNGWYEKEIYRLFEKYGISFFEALQIWHIPELKERFIHEVGKEPVSVTESPLKKSIKNTLLVLKKIIKY